MTEDEYDALAAPELRALVTALDDVTGDFDVEMESDILTLEFPDGVRYVVNSHRAARQIWMAAERSAWHFDWTGTSWVAKKTGDELWSTVRGVLERKTGKPIEIARPSA